MDVEAGAAPWAALEAGAEVHRTSCGDGAMVWRSWGSGPPLVLLHGGAGSWLHWMRTIPAFADRRVIAADLPGLGESAMPPEPTARAIAAVVAAGIDRLVGTGVPCDLAGFSFGGVIGGTVAMLRPLRSLVLVGSGGLGVIRGGAKLERVRDKVGAERDAAHRTNLHRWMIADLAAIDANALAIQDRNSRQARFDSRGIGTSAVLREYLPQAAAPIAGIWGEKDHSLQGEPHRAEAALRELAPRCPFTVIPGAGHWVMFEAADAFNAALRRQLDALGTAWDSASNE
jgi:2-hydroxy-6-oxonona-2,4-dienedioate hydrolase